MTDEGLRRWLDEADQPLAPDPGFASGLRDELRAELGFVPATSVRPVSDGVTEWRRSRGGPTRLLLVAALLTLAALGIALIAGSLVERPPERHSALYDEILRNGIIRIAIRPDQPQVTAPGQPAAGFDSDVAFELARRLGLRSDVVPTGAGAILSGKADDTWDIALPSVGDVSIDRSRFLLSAPYYRWPRRLIVLEDSNAQTAADLAGLPVCGVAAAPGEDSLRDAMTSIDPQGEQSPARLVNQTVTRATDDECLTAMQAGDAAGMVTARWSDADIRVRSGIKVIGGPEPEARAVVIRRALGQGPDPTDLQSAIDGALEDMHSDGTLTRLSQSRFGGDDLTAP